MQTYQLKLEDNIALEAEKTMRKGVGLEKWLQQQLNLLVANLIARSESDESEQDKASRKLSQTEAFLDKYWGKIDDHDAAIMMEAASNSRRDKSLDEVVRIMNQQD